MLVYPTIALSAGLIIAMLVFVILPMTFPAIWEGNTLTGIYARRWSLFQNRLMQIFTSQVVLGLIASLVATVVYTVLFSGLGIATLLSVPIIGSSINLDSLMSVFSLMTMMVQGGGGGVDGYIIAGLLGGGMLFFIAFLIPGLIVTFGINLIYLRAIEGMDFSAAEAGIAAKVEETKRRAEEAKARAADAAHRAREAASQRAAQSQSSGVITEKPTIIQPQEAARPASGLICPGCSVGITAADVFCGECGYKLK